MESEEDKMRRVAAKNEITDLGYIPILFEDWPSRPLPGDSDIIEYCMENVKDTDIFIIIVDDEVSQAMDEEHNAALEHLGPKKIFYYFDNHSNWL